MISFTLGLVASINNDQGHLYDVGLPLCSRDLPAIFVKKKTLLTDNPKQYLKEGGICTMAAPRHKDGLDHS